MSIAEIILETLVKTSNNNITITDEKGVILYTNSEHWTVYEDGPKEYIGKSIFELQELGILTPSITAKVLTEQKPIQIMQNTKKGKIESLMIPFPNQIWNRGYGLRPVINVINAKND